ncbi:DUF885 family protein [candidate division KSB1 bacterium]|nr:DUF885 family protein [candidate division KSB1 bacterium]
MFQNSSTSKILSFILILTFIIAIYLHCERSSSGEIFDRITNSYWTYYQKSYPVKASLLGVHQYDDQLDSWNREAIKSKTQALQNFIERLQKIDVTELSFSQRVDYHLLKTHLSSEIWKVQHFRIWERSPSFYHSIMKDAIISITHRERFTEQDCQNLMSRLNQLPALISQEKANLVNTNQIAIEQGLDEIISLRYLLTTATTNVAHQFPGCRDSLIKLQKMNGDSLTALRIYLEKNALPESSENQSVGSELHRDILINRYQIHTSTDSLLTIAAIEYQLCIDELMHISTLLTEELYNQKNAGYFRTRQSTERVLEKIYNNYTQNEQLIHKLESIVQEIDRFISTKGLISQPMEYTVDLERSPLWNIYPELTYIDYPGPFEEDSVYHFYLKSLPDNLTWLEQISFLKNLNKTVLQILAIQNITPGKILLDTHIKRQPSLVRKIFPAESFIEGWALFAGFMMVEAGYGGYDRKIELLQIVNYLRAVISAIIDIKFHSGELTKTGALNMLIGDGFMDLDNAEEHFRKIVLNPGCHILPFHGYVRIRDFYHKCLNSEEKNLSRSEFLNMLLGEGAIPIAFLTNELLEDNLHNIKQY